VRNENNKSSNCEEIEKVLKEIDDSSSSKTPTNFNVVPDFLKESDDNKTDFSEFMPPSSEKMDPLERLQREEAEFSKSSEFFNNENSSKYVLAEDLSVLFPGQINNISYEILEKVSTALFYQYSTEAFSFSLNMMSSSTFSANFGLPRCISVLNKKYQIFSLFFFQEPRKIFSSRHFKFHDLCF